MGKSGLIWSQTRALLYRNLLMKRRIKVVTIQEIVLPVYFVGLLVALKFATFKPTSYPFEPRANATSLFNNSKIPEDVTLLYQPNNPEQSSIMKRIEAMSPFQSMVTRGFEKKEDMVYAYGKLNSTYGAFGIEFGNTSKYEYNLRADDVPVPNRLYSGETDCHEDRNCPARRYFESGFTTVQLLVDTALAQGLDPSFPLPDVYACTLELDGGTSGADTFQIVSSLYLVMSMSFVMIFLLVFIVGEKEAKLTEGMKMMGLMSFPHWMSWFLTYACIIFITTLLMSIIAVFGQLYPNSDFFLIFLIFFLYGLSIELLAFMLTPFFSKARTAGAVGSLISLVVSLLYLIVVFVADISSTSIYFLSLVSPAGFAIGINQIAILDVAGGGATFSNMDSGTYPVSTALIMLTVDIFLYAILTLYFDAVVPGEYGRRNAPWFFLLPSYWCGGRNKIDATTMADAEMGEITNSDEENVEDVGEDYKAKPAIRIRNLCKTWYGDSIFPNKTNPTHAVRNFSLDIYEGQITALLGHNGAGKTTIFNILTGFVGASSGGAEVYGYDVARSDDIARVRLMTGVCPQHNMLFEWLTVGENLRIFAGIKNIPVESWKKEVESIVKLIDLEEQMNSICRTLSGGQKRKLSVGIAIMGDPKILILDEPTAGMDPLSRRKLWDVLRERREGKVTLLTTHFMDEADILSDRKAIISKGSLRCVGSSLFLKNRFGIGYHLSVVTEDEGLGEEIKSSVTGHVTGCEVHRESSQEIEFTLPIGQVDKFAGLFSHLEQNGAAMGVKSFGVSMTTLEEVFLKIGEEEEGEVEDYKHSGSAQATSFQKKAGINSAFADDEKKALHVEDPVSPFNNTKLYVKSISSIWKALVHKNLLVYLRNGAFVIFGFLFPLGLAIGSAAVLNVQGSFTDSTNPAILQFQPDRYQAPFLYKNSTGHPIDSLPLYVDTEMVESDLEQLLRRRPHAYLAADVIEYDPSRVSYVALYNTSGIHTLPIIINSMSQATISMLSGTSQTLKTSAQRWPEENKSSSFDGASFGGALMGGLSLLMATGIGLISPVRERALKIRSQLRISGVSFSLYWLSAFTFDYLWFLAIGTGYVASLAGFQVTIFTPAGALLSLVVLMVGWGASSILTTYCGSFIYDKIETAQSTWSILQQMTTLVPYSVVSILDQLGKPDIAVILHIVFSATNPYYAGFGGLYYITKVYTEFYRDHIDADFIPTRVYFDWTYPMVPFSIIMVYLHIVVFFFLLQVVDIRKSGGKWSDALKLVTSSSASSTSSSARSSRSDSVVSRDVISDGEDDDVVSERRRVAGLMKGGARAEGENPVVVVSGLRKEFSKIVQLKKDERPQRVSKTVVDDLSLSVMEGQVLGLLGPNGAGKTTTINMITAEFEPTRGKIQVCGHNVHSNVSEAFSNMGCCSQDNPLWENLTLREHLHIYALAQGIPSDELKTTIDNFVDALGIREHQHKRSKNLSGGTKRKLCFAISMLGNPQVVLLDEPSTGMDPKTKRFMWDTIGKAFGGSKRGAILTTHYMDEADALCQNIAIMVKGKLKCIGSTQHLKNKFGQGYTLEIKLKQSSLLEDEDKKHEIISKLKTFVFKLFGDGVSESEEFGNRFIYKVSRDSLSGLSRVFSRVESSKSELFIEEYSFSQSTLEQVFVRFAKEQDDEDGDENVF